MTWPLVLLCAALAQPQVQAIDIANGWKMESKGPWSAAADRRGLLAMRHPWEASGKGNFILYSRDVTVPKSWTGPVSLAFYCSDNYAADAPPPAEATLSADGFVGHRFKQVLADAAVVWSADVADAQPPGTAPMQSVVLPAAPGQTFRLGLLAYDAEASATILPRDFYRGANGARERGDDPDAAKFQTQVYFGDLQLLGNHATAQPGRRAVEAAVAARHEARWPIAPAGAWPAASARLELAADELPRAGFPVSMGIPFPPGRVKNADGFRLQGKDGKRIAVQKTALAQWPDGSLRWALLDFVARPGLDAVDLVFCADTAKAASRITIAERETTRVADAGNVSIAMSPEAGLQEIRHDGKAILGVARLTMKSGGEEAAAHMDTIATGVSGPLRAKLQGAGHFAIGDRNTGRYVLDASLYAGLPYMTLRVALVNDTDSALPIQNLTLAFDAAQFENPDSGKAGCLTWKGGAIRVRDAEVRQPLALQVRDGLLSIDLCAAGDAPVAINPGERLTRDIWFAFGAINIDQFAALVDRPPLLQSPEYYCASGAFGPARALPADSPLRQKLDAAYGGKNWAELGHSIGVRDYPDEALFGQAGNWAHNYNERMMGLWSLWLATGQRAWFDRANDLCRHLYDVAVIHSPVPGNDWLGAMHGPGANHAGPPWPPLARAAGLDLFYLLGGDPGYREAALDLTNHCARAKAGIDSAGARFHAAPFDSLALAYRETREAALLDEGAGRIDAIWKRIDRRRGAWPEAQTSQVYRATVPWFAGQLAHALYDWYWLTGDVEAAQALVALAEAVLCENQLDPANPPSPVRAAALDPRMADSPAYDPVVIPLLGAAYELSNDTFFLEGAKRQYQRWCDAGMPLSPFDTAWMLPWVCAITAEFQ